MAVVLRLRGVAHPCTIAERLNRFAVRVRVGGEEALAYNTNTGRLEELMRPGALGYCVEKRGGRLPYRLVAVEAPHGGYALIDTRLQEEAFIAAVEAGLVQRLRGCRVARRSPRVGASVLDYLLDCGGSKAYLELKSAAYLSWRGEALYPDCPTERGRRHLRTLAELARRGARAIVYFVAAVPGARAVRPNPQGDPELPDALLEALEAGVEAGAIGLEYDPVANTVRLYADMLPVIPV